MDELETLQSQELPALEQRRQLITEGAAASAKLDAAIELASKSLEPLRLRHDGATTQLEGCQDAFVQKANGRGPNVVDI